MQWTPTATEYRWPSVCWGPRPAGHNRHIPYRQGDTVRSKSTSKLSPAKPKAHAAPQSLAAAAGPAAVECCHQALLDHAPAGQAHWCWHSSCAQAAAQPGSSAAAAQAGATSRLSLWSSSASGPDHVAAAHARAWWRSSGTPGRHPSAASVASSRSSGAGRGGRGSASSLPARCSRANS